MSGMLIRRISCWSFVITVFLIVSAAIAETGNLTSGAGGGAKLRVECGQDLQRFCVGVQPGGGRLIQCLSSHTGELSEACGSMIASVAGGNKLRAMCGDDLQRFCIGVQPGGGRLVLCLAAHTRELSAACGDMIAARRARRDAPNSTAQNPPVLPPAPATTVNPPATMGSILRASCGPDAQRLCGGVRREVDVLKCLEAQRMELSTTCSLYFQKLGARPSAQKNIPNKKSPSLSPATPPTKPPGNAEPGPG